MNRFAIHKDPLALAIAVLLADGLDHLDAGPHPVTAVHDAMVHLVEHT